MTIPILLRKKRLAMNLTQREAGKRMGYANAENNMINGWECGRCVVGFKAWPVIARIYKFTNEDKQMVRKLLNK